MKKKQYKVKYERGVIKPLEEIELSGDKEGIVIFFDVEEDPGCESILKHAGTWTGNDFEECLEDTYNARGKTKF